MPNDKRTTKRNMTNTDDFMTLLPIRLAVQDCINQYTVLFDNGNFDDLVGLFAVEAIFDVSPSPSFMQVPLNGRAEIMENISRRYREVAATGARHQHVCTNTVFDEISQSRCATRTYLTSLAVAPEVTPRVATFGTYHDVFQPQGNRWVFLERRLTTETAIP